MPGLSVSDVVNVQVSLSPIAAAVRNFGSLLILGSSDVIDVTERRRLYTSVAAVAADFGTNAAEYAAALLFFSQRPQPASLYIGRWARVATAGLLHGGAMSAAEQLPAAWTGVVNGGFKITIDGVQKSLTALSFAAVANMNAVAAVINTALGVAATCTWNAVYSRLEIKSATTGAASTCTYAIAPAGGNVDISAQVRLTAATGAGAPVAGIIAEAAIDAVTIHAGSSDWYGLMIADTNAVDADHLAVAAFIEAASPVRIYGVTTQDAQTLSAASTTDLAAKLQALNYSRTFTQYSSTSAYAAASDFGRAFTVDFTAQNTTITLMYKGEPGVVAETLTESQAAVLKSKNCNVFVNYNNSTAIIQYGVMASGFYFDEVHGTDWLQNDMQAAIYNALYSSTTKLPQTDAGVNQLVTVAAQSCGRARNNGLIAPGVWGGPPLGSLNTGDTLTSGFYVYAPPVALQSSADRAARKAPTIQAAIKLAGAIHIANVLINVNR